MKSFVTGAALLLCSMTLSGVAVAQDTVPEADVTAIRATLEKINCQPSDDIEKEADDLYEVDDATCSIGQYDIKLDGDFNIVSLTKDF